MSKKPVRLSFEGSEASLVPLTIVQKPKRIRKILRILKKLNSSK